MKFVVLGFLTHDSSSFSDGLEWVLHRHFIDVTINPVVYYKNSFLISLVYEVTVK